MANNDKLVHSTLQKVTSHVQRQQANWFLNTILLEGYEVPFKYKRQKQYKSLKGAYVDIIYYAETETIASLEFEYMKVVKINLS